MVEADNTLLLTLLREIRTELRDLRAVTLGNTEARDSLHKILRRKIEASAVRVF